MASQRLPGQFQVPRVKGSPIVTQTFPGAPAGMNVALPAHELDDTEAQYIQDALLDKPGETRRRGPVRLVPGIAQLDHEGSGLAMTLTPQGKARFGVLNGNASNGYLSVLSADRASKVDLAWPHPLPTDPLTSASTRYRIIDIKAALRGGTWIGVSSDYDADSAVEQGLALWHGGTKANYSTGTITGTRGSAALTGTGTAWVTNVEPGMFVFANTDDGYTQTLIGTVLSVNSNTSITLTDPSPYPLTGKAYTIQSIRGFAPRVTTGRITADVGDTAIEGGETKFQSQGLDTGTWNVYRKNDMAWIGKVASVQSDTYLTLAANAAISVADEAYVAIRADADYSIETTANVNKVGFLTATYAQRQWFANNGAEFDKTHRVWFTDTDDPEAVDLSEDGDWIPVSSTGEIQEPIKALAPAYNALVVVKENETYAVIGSSPESFSVKKLEDDGALSGMSVQLYGGGVIWAGRQGIHFYDGIQTTNLMEAKFGDVWKNSIDGIDPTRYRMWSMMARNHYFLFIEDLDPTIAVVKGHTSTTPTTWTVAINMVTRSVVLMTNLHIRGAVKLPAAEGEAVWFLVNDGTRGQIVSADALFEEEGVDSVVSAATAGPDFYFHSKKFDGGDALRLKRFKEILLYYLVQGGSLHIDTVLGLNNVGKSLISTFAATVPTWDTTRVSFASWDDLAAEYATWDDVINAVFAQKRVRFMKRSPVMSFRLYEDPNATITRLVIGPYQIAYKLMRPGRV